MSSNSHPRHRRRHRRAALAAAATAALLAGCATRSLPPRAGADGAPERPPVGLERVPDAEPRVEPLRVGGPNKPYEALGQRYWPLAEDLPLIESGLASWYGRKFHGLPTASGETYDMYAMTAAHKTMPIPSYARVRNPANGREVIVRVNDRGPFAPGRVVDLSYTAALKLGVLGGVAPVEVARLTHAEIRAGSWRLPAPIVAAAAVPAVAPPTPAAGAPRSAQPIVAAAVPAMTATRPAAAGVAFAPSTAAAVIDDAAPGDDPIAAFAGAGGGWWLQLGAFRSREAAMQLQQRVLRELPALPGAAVFGDAAGVHRVQAGPWATREQALAASPALQRATGAAALVVSRGAGATRDATELTPEPR